MAAVVRMAKAYGARSLATMVLHLGDVTKDAYFQYLEQKHPDLVPEYRKLFRGKYARRDYQRSVQEVVAAFKDAFRLQRSQPVQPPAVPAAASCARRIRVVAAFLTDARQAYARRRLMPRQGL